MSALAAAPLYAPGYTTAAPGASAKRGREDQDLSGARLGGSAVANTRVAALHAAEARMCRPWSQGALDGGEGLTLPSMMVFDIVQERWTLRRSCRADPRRSQGAPVHGSSSSSRSAAIDLLSDEDTACDADGDGDEDGDLREALRRSLQDAPSASSTARADVVDLDSDSDSSNDDFEFEAAPLPNCFKHQATGRVAPARARGVGVAAAAAAASAASRSSSAAVATSRRGARLSSETGRSTLPRPVL